MLEIHPQIINRKVILRNDKGDINYIISSKQKESDSYSIQDNPDNKNIKKVNNSVILNKEETDLDLNPAIFATANVKIFLKEKEICEEAVKLYLNWKRINRTKDNIRLYNEDRIASIKAAFIDLYNGKEDPEALRNFKRDWGEEADAFLAIKKQLDLKLSKFKEQVFRDANNWDLKDRLLIAFRAMKQLPNLANEERLRLLKIVGYSKEDFKNFKIRLGASVPLYITLFASSDLLSDVAGFAGGITTSAINSDLSDPKTLAAVGGSAIAYYATQAIKVEQTLSMLKNNQVKIIPNPTAVLSYHLVEKMFADNPRIVNWLTRIGYVINPLELQQERWWLTLATPEYGPSIFVAGNVAAISINLMQLAAIEISRKVQAKRKNSNAINVKSETIFDDKIK